MPNETLARRYATAVFQLAQEANRVPAVQRDLHTFVDALRADDSVRRFFRSPVVDRKEKEAIVAQAFAALDPIALHTMLLLVRKRREPIAEEVVDQYDALERDARGAQVLQITSARPLPQAELDEIVRRLSGTYKTTFDVRPSVDPQLIGGIRMMMGNTAADGSVAGRLEDIARLLSAN